MSHTPAASTSSGGNSEHFAEFSTHNASPTHNTQFFLKCVSLSENLFQIMFCMYYFSIAIVFFQISCRNAWSKLSLVVWVNKSQIKYKMMVSTVCIHFREMILFSQVPAASQSERVCININMGQVVMPVWREWARTTQLCRAPWWHGRHRHWRHGAGIVHSCRLYFEQMLHCKCFLNCNIDCNSEQ